MMLVGAMVNQMWLMTPVPGISTLHFLPAAKLPYAVTVITGFIGTAYPTAT
ncbi:MAG: hypothetical protein ACLVL2_25200 [Bacteroides cellulosilyticus]